MAMPPDNYWPGWGWDEGEDITYQIEIPGHPVPIVNPDPSGVRGVGGVPYRASGCRS